MKKNKPTSPKLQRAGFLIALLLVTLTFNTYTMEPQDPKKIGWIAFAADVILYSSDALAKFLSYIYSKPTAELPVDSNQTEQPEFEFLPPKNQQTILLFLAARYNAATLNDAAHAINTLALVNQQLNTLINNPNFCLQIIKRLAKQFNCSDETVATALQTKEAKNRLIIQKKFEKLFSEPFFITEEFDNLYTTYKDYIDLNFTYRNLENSHSDDKNNLLIYGAKLPSPYKTSKIEALLNTHKININYQNSYGATALIACAYNCDNPAALQLLCKAPKIIIDLQDKHNNTALISTCLSIQNKQYKSACIFVLLHAGADPEKSNINEQTPLLIIEKIGNGQEIDFIKKAIEEKHGI